MKEINDLYFKQPSDAELDRFALNVIKLFQEHIQLNRVVQERVLLGLLNPGDAIPQELIDRVAPTLTRLDSNPEGEWIDENKRVVNREFSKFAADFFEEKVYRFFYANHLPSKYFDQDFHYAGKFREEVSGFFPLFVAILNHSVSLPDHSGLNVDAAFANDSIVSKFLYTYFSGRAVPGSFVNYYCEQMNPMPAEVANLVVHTPKGYRYLDVSVSSFNFQLAFLSRFRFTENECQSLYNTKLSAWRQTQI